jgi:hypothetical protein
MGFALGIASVVVALIGVGLSTYAASEQAAAQRRAAKREEKFREQEAESIRQAAEYEERQFRRRVGLLIGKQHAELAALGIDPASGSPLILALDTARQAELEALNVRRSGAQAASAREFEASLAGERRRALRYAGTYAAAGGAAEAGGSILRTFASRGWGSSSPSMPYSDTSSGLGLSYYRAGGGYYM